MLGGECFSNRTGSQVAHEFEWIAVMKVEPARQKMNLAIATVYAYVRISNRHRDTRQLSDRELIDTFVAQQDQFRT